LIQVEPEAASYARGPTIAGRLLRERAIAAGGDPNPEVFSCYSRCLAQLAGVTTLARTLRIFELDLLGALGYGLELTGDSANGEPLREDARYAYELEQGLRRVENAEADTDTYSGRDLLSLRDRELGDENSVRTAQRLLGRVLREHLGDRPLQSRLVLQDIVSRGL
jgi:DNA repair protein RecO (recombination protein O)